MRYRDPFTGRFTTRAAYGRSVQRIAREREKAFRRDDEKAFTRLTEKARKYPPLSTTRKPKRRAAPSVDVVDDLATEWEFGLTYTGD